MEHKKIRVAITHGDTNGIGYELIFKAFAEPQMFDLCIPIIYGSPKIAAYHRKALDIQANFSIINNAEEACEGRINMLACFDEEVKVDMGTGTEDSRRAAEKATERALEDFGKGLFDVLVAGPEGQEDGCYAQLRERLAAHFGHEHTPFCVLTNDSMRLTTITSGLPIKNVADGITAEGLEKLTRDFFTSLKRDFRIYNPRIAVLALNPGTDGHEESEVIAPVTGKLYDEGVYAFGPYQANTFFGNGMYESFDGVVAMYDDQGLIPFKTLATECGTCYVAGLPLVCTTPAHGARHDIAGTWQADVSPFRHAIYEAADILRNRATYDEPLANPLKKLYHEKRDDSDKVRFAVPKNEETEKDGK